MKHFAYKYLFVKIVMIKNPKINNYVFTSYINITQLRILMLLKSPI